MKKSAKKTHVAIVLDESGSMSAMREEAVRLYNEQIKAIRKNARHGGKTTVSLFKFGAHAAPHTTEVFHAKPPESLAKLQLSDYVPQNGTPMRDGVGLAITRLESLDDRGDDTAFLLIVVTDGQENQSKEWSVERLRKKVNKLMATDRWTFAVYGANISLADLQATVFTPAALPIGNFFNYVPTAAGLAMANANSAQGTAAYFSSVRVHSTMTTTFTNSGV